MAADLEKNILISKVIWLNCCTLAVVTNLNEIYIYSFEDGIPNKIGYRIFDKDCVKYSEKLQMLFFIKDSFIYSLNPFNGIENYKINLIKLGKYSDVEFDIDSDNEEIVFRKRGGLIAVYNINNGEKKWDIKLRCSFLTKLQTLQEKRVLQISKSNWLLYNKNDCKFMVYDNCKKTAKYLLPPIKMSGMEMLIGRNSVIFYNEQVLYWINLTKEFEIYYYFLGNAYSFSWRVLDDELSVLSSSGLQILTKLNMKQFQTEKNCLVSKKSVFDSLFFSLKKTSAIITNALKFLVPQRGNFLNYKSIFDLLLFDEEFEKGDINRNGEIFPTIIEYSDESLKAVAFEELDTIVIYNKKEEKVSSISNLNLAINDNILKMQFSFRSRYFLLWRNHSVQVFDLEKSRCILNVNVAGRPVYDVGFEKNCQLNIAFCDGLNFVALPTEFKKFTLPKRIVENAYNDKYCGPYRTYVSPEGKRCFMPMLKVDNFNIFKFAGEWLIEDRIYTEKGMNLLFEDGEFYLNADKRLKFDKGFCDFRKSIEIERFKDDTAKSSYMREKNDLFSKLYTIGDLIVLVSRMMNSVIVFDVNQMRIIGTYKHSSNIIESRLGDNNLLELNCDSYPFVLFVKINK